MGNANDLAEQSLTNTTDTENDDANQQYVTFSLGKEVFAFPMQDVREIIRLPNTVDVPLTPDSLVGLANLRGAVLPVLDMRILTGQSDLETTESTRVVVVECNGHLIGLVVDRVARVMSVSLDRIESSDTVKSALNAELIQGIVKDVDGHALIQLLDVKQVIEIEFDTTLQAVNHGSINAGGLKQLDQGSEDDVEDGQQLVSFTLDGQEYAFDLTEVQEIVRMPSDVATVPNTDAHVLGMINLRSNVLPLVNMRNLFELENKPITEVDRIVVLTSKTVTGKEKKLGIVVDEVKEVLRVQNEEIDAVPGMLAKDTSMHDVSGICRLDQGKRLVSILSHDGLFNDSEVEQALSDNQSDVSAEDIDMQDNTIDEDTDETQLVVFHLDDQEFGISIDAVREITRVPNDMNKVPKTPEFIEGMVNLRGAVLPVIDMRQRFQIDKMDRSDRQRILVIEFDGVTTGFITDSVSEVLRLSKQSIEDAPNLSDEQVRILGKVVNLREQNRMIQVLDASQLLNHDEVDQLAETA